MTWLFHNYFLPTLNPSAAPQGQKMTLRPLTPILKRYKSLLKLTTRDASLRAQYHPEINALLRDVERWVAEARVAASVEGFGDVLAEDEDQDQDQDVKELWALEKLCDAFMEPGILVPLSKKCHLSLFPPSIFRS
jgi:ribosomal biogenesis protein LAS1